MMGVEDEIIDKLREELLAAKSEIEHYKKCHSTLREHLDKANIDVKYQTRFATSRDEIARVLLKEKLELESKLTLALSALEKIEEYYRRDGSNHPVEVIAREALNQIRGVEK